MSDLKLTGTVKRITEIQTFTSGFQKREMVILTQEQYPQPINIEFLSDKIDLLNGLNENDEVTVYLNIRGREWLSPQGETKYFNSITGWKIDKATATTQQPAPVATSNPFADDSEDLPF